MFGQALDVQTIRTLITVLVGAAAAAAFPALKDLLLELVRARQRRAEAVAAQKEARLADGRVVAQRCLDVIIETKTRADDFMALAGLEVGAFELTSAQRSVLDSASVLIPDASTRIQLVEALQALDAASLVQKWGEADVSERRFRFLTLEALQASLGAYIRGDDHPSDAAVLLARHSTFAQQALKAEEDDRMR